MDSSTHELFVFDDPEIDGQQDNNFKIKCNGRRTFFVSQTFICRRSRYFQILLSKKTTSELDLTQPPPNSQADSVNEESHPLLMYMLLRKIHDMPPSSLAEAVGRLRLSGTMWEVTDSDDFDERLSRLVRRFEIGGVEH